MTDTDYDKVDNCTLALLYLLQMFARWGLDRSGGPMRNLHEWELAHAAAREVQTRLAGKVRFERLRREPRSVARPDCAFTDGGSGFLRRLWSRGAQRGR